jgi:hypothetical protein
MIRILSFFALFIGLINPVKSFAAVSPNMTLDGVDLTPYVEFYKSQVKTLSKEVRVYNWSQHSLTGYWMTDHSVAIPELSNLARSEAKVFWDRYGESNNNMYGYGLYAALDPVATAGFGGLWRVTPNYFASLKAAAGAQSASIVIDALKAALSQWLLLEMNLPVGFSMLELNYGSENNSSPSQTTIDIAAKFNCPTNMITEELFRTGGSTLNINCQKLVKKVFSEILKIDGFSYSYSSTYFKDCSLGRGLENRAFVITNPKWITLDNIRYYSESSRSEKDRRIAIQSLFFTENDEKRPAEDVPIEKIISFMQSHSGYFVQSSTSKCHDASCTISVHFCDLKKQCEDIDLDPIDRPGGALMTEEEAEKTVSGHLLWPDLEGAKKLDSTQTKNWLKDHDFACTGELPFQKDASAPAEKQK